jgi:hypothetical protein
VECERLIGEGGGESGDTCMKIKHETALRRDGRVIGVIEGVHLCVYGNIRMKPLFTTNTH